MSDDGGEDQLATFFTRAQPRLQLALTAAYAPVDGRASVLYLANADANLAFRLTRLD